MVGAGLVVIGIIFLLKNLGIMPDIAWDIIWPIILIVIGLTMIFKKK
ncbi:MAG: DUF5668 domain-containing protein [Candidatus Buchananbacteria bacterium]|nr:DUF5668 domain-containing protein [Candidatus Buchananbacteria bacterium]